MTAYLAGLVYLRADDPACDWPSRADGLDGIALAILATMATFSGEGDPHCWASTASIARRSRFGLTAVKAGLRRLERVKSVESDGGGKDAGRPINWRLCRLDGGSRETATPTDKVAARRLPPSRETTTGSSPDDHNPSDLLPTPREEGREEDSAALAASAGATAAARAEGTADVDPKTTEYLTALALSTEDARTLTEQILKKCRSTSPATRRDFLRDGLRREVEAAERRASSPKPAAKPATGGARKAPAGKAAPKRKTSKAAREREARAREGRRICADLTVTEDRQLRDDIIAGEFSTDILADRYNITGRAAGGRIREVRNVHRCAGDPRRTTALTDARKKAANGATAGELYSRYGNGSSGGPLGWDECDAIAREGRTS